MSAETVTVSFKKIVYRRDEAVKLDLGEKMPVWFPLQSISLNEASTTVTVPEDLMAEKIVEAQGMAGPHGGRLQIGYARATTEDPSLNVQLGALRRAGCTLIFTDTVSAGSQQRHGLRKARTLLREGDVLVVWRLDRLVGTVKTLVHLITEIAEEGVHFRSLSDAIDTMTPSGHFFFDMIFLLAQMERELIAEAEQTKDRQDAEGKRPWAGGVNAA